MTKSVTIVFLFFSTYGFGQLTKESIYKTVSGLAIVDSASWPDIDGFYTSNGFCGYNFQLNSDMTFQQTGFCCMESSVVDSGIWEMKNQNTLILTSNTKTLSFDIVRFDKFYFLVLSTQRQKFADEIKAMKIKLKNKKPFIIDNRTYTTDYLISIMLIKEYYAKELEDTDNK